MTPATTPTPPAVTVPLEPTTPIRPSEAIRLGCLIAPVQHFGGFGTGDEACVTAAMNLGLGHSRADNPTNSLPWKVYSADCPVSGCPGGKTYVGVLYHLNDDHRWSRERIADWLESLGL